eukprot:13565161-Ditylum_brightwellii.AAC.1
MHKAQQCSQYKDIQTYLKQTNAPTKENNPEEGRVSICSHGVRAPKQGKASQKKKKGPKMKYKEDDIQCSLLKLFMETAIIQYDVP